MKKFDLSGIWQLSGGGYNTEGNIPGSVYSILLENKLMDDPFYRDNELKALEIMDNEFAFSRNFIYKKPDCPVLLHCDGLDTICDIYINSKHIAYTDNMHRSWEFAVENLLVNGENEITITVHPTDAYIKAKQAKKPLSGAPECMAGFGYIRKAYCMMGWDWGARLPDGGIWRDIYLLEKNSARITDFHITQRHENGKVFVTPEVKTDADCDIKLTVTSPDDISFSLDVNRENEIKNPELWWPNGLGKQALYTFKAELLENGNIVDCQTKEIGLRTLKLIREKDRWGESFCHEVNGIKFFAMGADYIPEDSIYSRITPSRTEKLLQICKDSNFNAIRVWGGGYYPDDYFFEYCDKMGLVVFIDLMFACVHNDTSPEMIANIKAEIEENLTRIRHHACIGVISGNNEMEAVHAWSQVLTWLDDYLDLFEELIPNIVKKVCPYIPYIPSSPTSFGHVIEPSNENYGDSHYWAVWHGNQPFTEYRNHYFRYLSEFGFQSFPCEKTVNSFTEEKDRNIFSRIMEMHQKSFTANGKILNYLSMTYKYPAEFGTLLYASQLLQADAIKYGVEHLRRNRGRCMGTLYWQLNDTWPVASWSSIDYYGRFKALQYYAKRFYTPVLLSCMEIGEKDARPIVNTERTVDYTTKATLCLTNDTLNTVTGDVIWELRNRNGEILQSGSQTVTVEPLSVKWLEEMDFNKTDVNNNYFSYRFIVDGKATCDSTALFTAPKYFDFKDPELSYELNGDEITVFAKGFAKSVEIDSPDSDFILEDNFFDMNAGSKTVKILSGTPKNIKLRSVYDIR